MSKLTAIIFAGVVFCALSLAQEQETTRLSASETVPQAQAQENPAQSGVPVPLVAPGSVIPVRLTSTVDARKAKAGDKIEARITQDLTARSGELLVPQDTKVVGHITEVQARTKEQKESQVGIAFDHAVMKDGSAVSLPMSIQAIVALQILSAGNNSDDEEAGPPTAAPSPGALPQSGRSSGIGTRAASPAPSSVPVGGEPPASASTGNLDRRSITANTQGIVGIPDLRLSTPGDVAPGSLITSEKNNVKLESGTLMLLRVNQ
jgi:hypothetical protein